MIAFRRFIEKYTKLPDNEWQIIQQNFEMQEFAKGEFILSKGKVCKFFYFLEQGLIRYFVDNEGDDITKFFTVAPYCFTSRDSFRNQKPSMENIQTLEKTIVWRTSFNQSNELLELKSWNSFTRMFVNEVQGHFEDLLNETKTETAEYRYQKLLEKHPDLIPKIPLKYLSTFLGIAPQSMSRIRKKLR